MRASRAAAMQAKAVTEMALRVERIERLLLKGVPPEIVAEVDRELAIERGLAAPEPAELISEGEEATGLGGEQPPENTQGEGTPSSESQTEEAQASGPGSEQPQEQETQVARSKRGKGE